MDSTPNLRRAELVQAIEEVDAHTWELAGLIRRRATDAWIWHEPNKELPDKADLTGAALRRRDLDAAAACFRTLEYVEGQDSKGTIRLVGLLAVPADVIECARRANAAKDRLEKAWQAIAADKIEIPDPDGEGKMWVPLRRYTLKECGRERHHQRQASRHIVTLDQAVKSVSFSWARVPTIRRTDCRKVRELLEEMLEEGSPLAAADLERLAALAPDEPLTLIGGMHIQPRANVEWIDASGIAQRKMVRAMMPILVLGERLPRFRRLPPAPLPKEYRLARVKRISDEPYLQTLNVHRYVDPAAACARHPNTA